MKKTKFLRQLTSMVVTLSMTLSLGIGKLQPVSAAENTKTQSQKYVEAMGKGWNLCNTYDSLNTTPGAVSDETSWGMPQVTKDLIKAVKAKGFDSIRIPMTAYTRYSLVNGHYVIDSAWLAKYKQTVDWAVEAGLYVMINIHHDSWAWLSGWDGNKTSEEYKRYVDLWTQLADAFKDEPNQVCFETINEPQFSDTGSITAQDKLNMINQAAYDAIRKSGGNNATRMIVIPTLNTSSDLDKVNATYNFITSLNDPYIIATVHGYSDWIYSGNLGMTSFDDVLWKQSDGSDYTPRVGVENLFNTIYSNFTAKGIGVVIGEYGLLSPDSGAAANQAGEKQKYFELMNYMATKDKISLMLWQNVIDRYDTKKYSYNPPILGSLVDAAIHGERSSYAMGLNEIYLSQPVDNGIQIPLTLNGNSFKGIVGLTKGKDYTYNEATATVTLSKAFVNTKFNSLAADKYGQIADLVMKFSSGADWHQYLIKNAAAVLKPAAGTTADGINIPVDFNGSKLKRAAAYDSNGNRIGGNSWWTYCQFGYEFTADYDKGTISVLSAFLNDGSVKDGQIKFTFEFYDGQVINYILVKNGTGVTGISEVN